MDVVRFIGMNYYSIIRTRTNQTDILIELKLKVQFTTDVLFFQKWGGGRPMSN